MEILLVEDNPTDSKLFCAVLSASANSVTACGSAEKVFEAIKIQLPEVILLDLKLPGMDGLELARRLKKDKTTKHIPIVAITAAQELFSREAALEAGCDSYIVKPVNVRGLDRRLKAVAGIVNSNEGGNNEGSDR